MQIEQAFVLAGGKGERLRPLTDSVPKPLVEVNGTPILEYTIRLLARHGVQEVILATGYMHEKLEAHFGSGEGFGLSIVYSVEKEPLGTGGALKEAEAMLDETFFMFNGDNIADFDLSAMAKLHLSEKAMATIALAEVDDVSGFGVARVNGGKITEFVEKPQNTGPHGRLVNAGAYVIEKSAVKMLPDGFSLIERAMFPQLAQNGKLSAYVHKGLWLTTDTFKRLKAAEKALVKTAAGGRKKKGKEQG